MFPDFHNNFLPSQSSVSPLVPLIPSTSTCLLSPSSTIVESALPTHTSHSQSIDLHSKATMESPQSSSAGPFLRNFITTQAQFHHTANSQPFTQETSDVHHTTCPTKTNHLVHFSQDKIFVLSSPETPEFKLVPGEYTQQRAMTNRDSTKANKLKSPKTEPSTANSLENLGASKSISLTPSITHNSFTPTYHTYSKHKLSDWTFSPNKPVIIIGDSNLNRIPPHMFSNIQIDSYPGMTTYHLWKLLEKTSPAPLVQKLVISIGINNKDLDPKNTTNKQLLTIHRLAKKIFPNATIHFALLNFSPYLTPIQIHNLTEINLFTGQHVAV